MDRRIVAALAALVAASTGGTAVMMGAVPSVPGVGGGSPKGPRVTATPTATPEPGTAHLWVDSTGGTCTRDADQGGYVDAAACSSFDAAWDAATAGDTIRVKTGAYGQQTITGDKASETFIVGETGTTVTGNSVCAGGGTDGALCANAGNMTLQNLTVDAEENHGQSSGAYIGGTNVTWTDVDAIGPYVSIDVQGDGFTWDGGSLGADGTTGGARQNGGECGAGDGEPVWLGADNVTFDGIRFNAQRADETPTSCSSNGFHLELIRVQGAQNFTIRNSRFLNGSNAGSGQIFVTNTTSSATAAQGLTIENVVFAATTSNYVLQVHANVQNCAWEFSYNTFAQPVLFDCGDASGMVWTGNLGAITGCSGTHVKNVFQRSSALSCGSNTYVIGTSEEVDQLNLNTDGTTQVGSEAVDGAETPGASDVCTGTLGSVDYEGDVRPIGSVCDAGADEVG